jgi:thioredoxin 1
MKVLKFEASWCQPCKMMSKVIAEAKDKITVQIDPVDIDDNQELAKQYNIRGVPTLVVVDDSGAEVKRKVGALSEKDLIEFLK